MKTNHPFRRGLLLAAAFAVMMVLTGTPSLYETFAGRDLSREALAFAAMLPIGALVASMPARIRRRGQQAAAPRIAWQECAVALLGGATLGLGAYVAGGGDVRMLAGAMQGGLGAMAFVAVAACAAVITRCILGHTGAPEKGDQP